MKNRPALTRILLFIIMSFFARALVAAEIADINPDLEQAIAWYIGSTGQVDDSRAKQHLEKAIATGDTLAIMWLARVHSTGRMEFEKDYSLAQKIAADIIDEVESLARQNHAEAMFLMGTAYAEGLGKDKDAAVAASWYLRLASAPGASPFTYCQRAFSRSYGTILPSSFTRVLSSALVFST